MPKKIAAVPVTFLRSVRRTLILLRTKRRPSKISAEQSLLVLTAAGVCVGFVVGVLETLRSVNLSCIPKDISNVQLVRTVLNQIENHPEWMRQDFAVSVRAAMMKSWPCRKRKGPRLVARPKR